MIENPGACTFDPKALQCSGAEDSACLTPAQVESARAMYAGASHPVTRATVLPGLARGSELAWNVIGGPAPIGFAVEGFKYVIAKDPAWDGSRFDPRLDHDRAQAIDPDDVLGSTDVNMRAFFARGGKLMLYHGWSDAQVTPYNTIDFFQKVVASQGGAGVGTSIQLYMVPGMNHCAGGPGTDTVRPCGRHRGVDQDRLGAEAHRGLARDRRNRRPHAAALSLRAGGAVERHRQHERSRPTSPASPPRWNPRASICVPYWTLSIGQLESWALGVE